MIKEVYMEEKAMVKEAFEETKMDLLTFQRVIIETKNMELRQTIQQIRNNCESFQYELLKIAEIKNYCKESPKATAVEISSVKTEVQTFPNS